MRTSNYRIKGLVGAAAAAVLFLGSAAHAYGPLVIQDYEEGKPYLWDVSNPVPVYTDGGNFASGTVFIWVETPETCNPEGGWNCGYYDELYVEFTNEQGVARVAEALESWSSVPTSVFQAAVAGSFADIGIGGADGDITGAPEEFLTDSNGNVVHEVIGSVNGGGIHVLFDEDGSVMTNVMGAPFGVLGIASPEFAIEETGEITEGWVVIGGAQTYFNDDDLEQMAGVITHEFGHSFNLAHSQVNGHIVFYGNFATVTPGPKDCSAHWSIGGEYRLPFPQSSVATAADISVMYPFINNNPAEWSVPTGEHQATVDTAEDLAAISFLYPDHSFWTERGTIHGHVKYAFSDDGVIGVNVIARNIDNPYEDAISVMTGDFNDGVPGAALEPGEFVMMGLTPGAQYVIHTENIYAGGFPTPQVSMPGPSEYYNGEGESDLANEDDACDYVPLVVGAGEVLTDIEIKMNGMKNTPQLVIVPAPSSNNITEDGFATAGTIINWYGAAESWIHVGLDKNYNWLKDSPLYESLKDTLETFLVLPMGGITLSDNGQVVAGRTVIGGEFRPARYYGGEFIEVIPTPGNNACDSGGGFPEYYSHFAISPDGNTMGGFLWNCDNSPDYGNFLASAATYSDEDGWTILHDHALGTSSRVNGLADNGVAVGWVADMYGWWGGHVWMDGQEINLKDHAPANITDVGEATAVSSDGEWVVGINSLTDLWEQFPYRYNTETSEFEVLEISEPCPPWDWFCFGATPFYAYDISDTGTMTGAMGTAGSSQATMVSDVLGGKQKLVDFLKGQGVINATDLSLVSNATKITSNGRHITGWTILSNGAQASFKLDLERLYVCEDDTSQRVPYPNIVELKLNNGATLGMCEADLPLQYK